MRLGTENVSTSNCILQSSTQMFHFKKHPYEQLFCQDGKADAGDSMKERLRSLRHATAKSKSGVWGPTHSDSEDEDENDVELNKTTGDRSGGTNTTLEESFSFSRKGSNPDSKGKISNSPNTGETKPSHEKRNRDTPESSSPSSPFHCSSSGDNNGFIAEFLSSATAVVNELLSGDCSGACNQCQGSELLQKTSRKANERSSSSSKHNTNISNDIAAATLGIQRLSPPSKEISFKYQKSNASSLTDGVKYDKSLNTPITRRKSKELGDEDARAAARVMAEVALKSSHEQSFAFEDVDILTKNLMSDKKSSKGRSPPFNVITVNTSVPFQKSISELTMRSSYGEATTPISDMRRMAYYAVGKNHSQKGGKGANSGGNRKCYFTGDPIASGRPFYAGSVQQGMRTLIVFCLPSALGLPKKEDLERMAEIEVNSQFEGRKSPDELSRRTMTGLSTAALSQHDSIYNEEGFVMSELFHSTAWTEDENGNLCESLNTEFLLQALPDPNRDLLLCMQDNFPEQFASLSPHLRRPQCWRLYVKFCFFSGLPIADGEMYYKVMDDIFLESRYKKSAQTEEIVLSHEVMEAVSGESADLRILPGNNTFKYLQKHYKQQCAKLTPQKFANKVFDRSSWIRVMPEV